ncbi:MAG: putative glutamine cyclotransferase [Deltaproteobacteria bacterium]|nr:putative glutamine cyclotransferase [Deltaproteobacteria bacterium]
MDRAGLLTVLAVWLILILQICPVHAQSVLARLTSLKTGAPISSIVVVNVYPHDPANFTQGLFFHQGYFYESTGLHGRSFLYRKDIKTGKTLQKVKIAQEYFGEGLALLKNKIYQLTWKSGIVFVYDSQTFQTSGRMKYEGEGWGLTSDGRHLLMSNGSSTITIREPDSFKVVRKIDVLDGNRPVDGLNELEFIKGEIWAHIFTEDMIVRISPKSGRVVGWIDLSVLRSYLPQNAQVDVINGLAYDAKEKRIFVTGKLWPNVFEIQVAGHAN